MNNPKTCPSCKTKDLNSKYKWCPYCGSWLRDRQYQSISIDTNDNPIDIEIMLDEEKTSSIVDKIHIPQYLK